MLPDNLRSLTIVRLPSGDYQANLNTADMPTNTFRIRIADTPLAALRDVCAIGKVRVIPPVPNT